MLKYEMQNDFTKRSSALKGSIHLLQKSKKDGKLPPQGQKSRNVSIASKAKAQTVSKSIYSAKQSEKSGKTQTKKLTFNLKDTVTITKNQLQDILESAGLKKDEKTSAVPDVSERSPSPPNFSEDIIEVQNIEIELISKTEKEEIKAEACIEETPAILENVDHALIEVKSPDLIPVQHHTSPSKSSNDESVISSDPGKKMSLVEQKRLQWAKERAQMQYDSEWNPWGRPGCGAPIHTAATSRKSHLDWSDTQKPSKLPPLPQTTISTASRSVPSTMKTSFLFGATSQDSLHNINKEEEKRKWLEELDRQREEQRLRKLLDQENFSSIPIGTDKLTFHEQSSISHRPSISQDSGIVIAVPIVESPYLTPSSPNDITSGSSSAQRTFLRGANIPMDPETKAEMERKRQKQREQQLAIQAQLEEKQRRIQEEQERLRQEELEEEKRIARQCQIIQQQYENEEKKNKNKVQNSNPCAAVVVPTAAEKPSSVSPQVPQSSPQTEVYRNDMYSAASEFSKDCKSPVAEENIQIWVSSPYIENRVLTPTKYRGVDILREFGTQTELSLSKDKLDKAIDTDSTVENDDHSERSVSSGDKAIKKKISNKTSKKRSEQTDSTKLLNRPKWGASHSDKTYQKQSEKDVRYSSSHRAREVRQKRLEHEAALQRGQPQVGKSRSSAHLQRHLLANESATPSTTPIRTVSPTRSHHTTSENDSFPEDSSPEISTRKQRKQWDSPRADEIPNFYTQAHQLPARRNSRSQSLTVTPDRRTPLKANHELYARCVSSNTKDVGLSSWNSVNELRSHSPPIPTLRHRMASLDNVTVNLDSKEEVATQETSLEEALTKSLDSFGVESHSMKNSKTFLIDKMGKDTPISKYGSDSQLLRKQTMRGGNFSADTRYSSDTDFIPYLRSSVTLDTPRLTADNLSNKPVWPQRSRILQQLSTIRQGLKMKQQEMEYLLYNGRDSSSEQIFKL